MMKILLVNLPSGRVPTDYPPVAISRVIEGLDPALDCEASFYDMDLLRPSFERIAEKIREVRPQVIGFSAILTPTYKYLKGLSLLLKKEFPDLIQVLGGEMAVIHGLILKKTPMDFCVVGQAEPAFSSLLAALKGTGFSTSDKTPFKAIKGLAFLDGSEAFFTGDEHTPENVRQINYDLLARHTDIRHYIHAVDGPYFRNRIGPGEIDDFFSLLRPENLKKNMTTVFASKGCVGRCTFCHRYFKGYSALDDGQVTDYIRRVAAERNVGLLLFQEEDFGSNAAVTARITAFLKESGLNWTASAVRAKTATEAALRTWKESGCVNVNFGIESCSQKMLDVMEKSARLEDNLNALRLCNKYRIATIISLVIGMPGETEDTIDETIANLASVLPDSMDQVYEVSINFFQAVPGTPGYDFARHAGAIDSSPEGTERYIEGLHEAAANEISHYLNFTDYEKEEVLYWKDYIPLELLAAYLRKHGALRVLRRKRARRYYYAAVYGALPRPGRKFLLKYLTILRHYGGAGLLGLLRRKLFNRRPVRYAAIDRSLRLINKDLEAGKPWPTLKK